MGHQQQRVADELPLLRGRGACAQVESDYGVQRLRERGGEAAAADDRAAAGEGGGGCEETAHSSGLGRMVF